MKTLHTDFKLWVGEDIFYISKGNIIHTYVYEVQYQFRMTTNKDDFSEENITYVLQNGIVVTEKDINTIYFTDKNELIKHLVSQL